MGSEAVARMDEPVLIGEIQRTDCCRQTLLNVQEPKVMRQRVQSSKVLRQPSVPHAGV